MGIYPGGISGRPAMLTPFSDPAIKDLNERNAERIIPSVRVLPYQQIGGPGSGK